MISPFIEVAIPAVILFNILLGVVVYLSGEDRLINRIFLALSFSSALWAFAILMQWIPAGQRYLDFWSNTAFIGPTLFAAFFLYFSFVFPRSEASSRLASPKLVFICILVPAVIVILLAILQQINIKTYDPWTIERGFGIHVFNVYLLVYLVYAFINLYRRMRGTHSTGKKQMFFIFTGFVTALFVASFFNLLLPLGFDYAKLTFIGPTAGGTIFVLFITYAILKHHLFNIKVIATELFVFALWTFLLIRALLSGSFPDLLINGTLFFATIVIGVLLIRSVMKEVRQAEHIHALMKMKEEFMQTASHQLRTPVTVIKGTLDALRDGDLDTLTPEKREIYLDRAYIKAEKLNSIITDILSATEIDDPEFSMTGTLRPLDIKQMVARSVDSHEQLVQEKGIKLVFEDVRDVSLVNGSEQFLPEAIDNYISNAIQYTPKGGTITVRLFEENGFVVCTVSDTGIGIPPEDMEKLWNKFIRAKNANDAHTDGSGLGLYIVKGIVEGHPNGEVFVESKLGEGSTFGFKLRVAENTV